MPRTRTIRGAMTAFLDAQASWIKANLHRQQCDIAGDLLDMIPTDQPRIDLGAMKVALCRWLEKRGWSDKQLRALGVECILRGAEAPVETQTAAVPVSHERSVAPPNELRSAPSILPTEQGTATVPMGRPSGAADPAGLLTNEVRPAPPRNLPLAVSAGPPPSPATGRYMSASFFAPAKPKEDTP